MKLEQIHELESVGLPPRFHFYLHELNEEQQLHRLTLPAFLAFWCHDEYVQHQTNGDTLMRYGEYVQMQALMAEIGATVSSTSGASHLELILLLSNSDEPSRQNMVSQWKSAIMGAREVVNYYDDAEHDLPRSLHHVMAELAFLEGPRLYPELEGAETVGEIAATEIDFTLINDDWLGVTRRAFNVGIMIPKLFPEFYYATECPERRSESDACDQESMAEIDEDQPHLLDQDMTRIKREFHLAKCRIWSLVCRPDLAYLLKGP